MINRYKCHTCHLIFGGKSDCPDCGNEAELICERDRACTCSTDIHSGIQYCPACGKPTCPCGSHDVGTISRVTGYLSEVSGWNAAKKQELKDRQRVTV